MLDSIFNSENNHYDLTLLEFERTRTRGQLYSYYRERDSVLYLFRHNLWLESKTVDDMYNRNKTPNLNETGSCRSQGPVKIQDYPPERLPYSFGQHPAGVRAVL